MKKKAIVQAPDIFTVTITNPSKEAEVVSLLHHPEKKKESRHYCARCHDRRYRSKMELLFYHPIVSPIKIYTCIGECTTKYKQDLLMYTNTGAFQLVEIKL